MGAVSGSKVYVNTSPMKEETEAQPRPVAGPTLYSDTEAEQESESVSACPNTFLLALYMTLILEDS